MSFPLRFFSLSRCVSVCVCNDPWQNQFQYCLHIGRAQLRGQQRYAHSKPINKMRFDSLNCSKWSPIIVINNIFNMARLLWLTGRSILLPRHTQHNTFRQLFVTHIIWVWSRRIDMSPSSNDTEHSRHHQHIHTARSHAKNSVWQRTIKFALASRNSLFWEIDYYSQSKWGGRQPTALYVICICLRAGFQHVSAFHLVTAHNLFIQYHY